MQNLPYLHVITLLLTFLSAALGGSNQRSKEWLEANSKKDGVITLKSGLQYKVLRKGAGEYHPTIDSPCECHYKGTLIDGTQFDSSYDRGQPTTFAPNQVIKGWTEAMQLMVEGDKFEMYIPSELGYGDHGSPPKIGPGDALVFTMEIIKIKGGKVPAVACDINSLNGCSDEEKKYVQSAIKKFNYDADFIQDEIDRINKVAAENPAASDRNKSWGLQRVHILKKMLEKSQNTEL